MKPYNEDEEETTYDENYDDEEEKIRELIDIWGRTWNYLTLFFLFSEELFLALLIFKKIILNIKKPIIKKNFMNMK